MNAGPIIMSNDVLDIDWSDLNAIEIYDHLTEKGGKLETQQQTNKIIRELKKHNHLPQNASAVAGKSKKHKQAQRMIWSKLSEEGLTFLREEMHKFFTKSPDDDDLQLHDVPENIRARAWHLVEDPRAVGYLELIFSAQLDDKATRAATNWVHLCAEFFNREDWAPENPFDDIRLQGIDPSKPPLDPYQPDKLRKLFSKMRSLYSTFNHRYHRSLGSGLFLESDSDGDDDEVFENFGNNDMVLLYAHKLFKYQPPRYCTSDLDRKSDVGVGDGSSCTHTTTSSLTASTAGANCGRKRKHVELSKDDHREIFAQSDAEKARDESIARIFTLTRIENTINANSFKLLPPATQEAVMKNWREMLAESS